MSLIYQSPDLVNGRRPGIYVGGKADAKNKERLLDRNVTHILNLTPTKEASIRSGVPNYFEKRRSRHLDQYQQQQQQNHHEDDDQSLQSLFTYHRISVYDASTSCGVLRDAADAEICAFIATALLHGSVLVHCQRGVSRSVTAVLFYLMRRVGMPLDDAMALVKRRRPEANPIPAFVAMLREYETQCRLDGSIVDASCNDDADAASGSSAKNGGSSSKKRAATGPSRPEAPKQQQRSSPSTVGPLCRPPAGNVAVVVEPSSAQLSPPHSTGTSSALSPAAAAETDPTNIRGDAAMEQGIDAAAPSSSESSAVSVHRGEAKDEGETSSTL